MEPQSTMEIRVDEEQQDDRQQTVMEQQAIQDMETQILISQTRNPRRRPSKEAEVEVEVEGEKEDLATFLRSPAPDRYSGSQSSREVEKEDLATFLRDSQPPACSKGKMMVGLGELRENEMNRGYCARCPHRDRRLDIEDLGVKEMEEGYFDLGLGLGLVSRSDQGSRNSKDGDGDAKERSRHSDESSFFLPDIEEEHGGDVSAPPAVRAPTLDRREKNRRKALAALESGAQRQIGTPRQDSTSTTDSSSSGSKIATDSSSSGSKLDGSFVLLSPAISDTASSMIFVDSFGLPRQPSADTAEEQEVLFRPVRDSDNLDQREGEEDGFSVFSPRPTSFDGGFATIDPMSPLLSLAYASPGAAATPASKSFRTSISSLRSLISPRGSVMRSSSRSARVNSNPNSSEVLSTRPNSFEVQATRPNSFELTPTPEYLSSFSGSSLEAIPEQSLAAELQQAIMDEVVPLNKCQTDGCQISYFSDDSSVYESEEEEEEEDDDDSLGSYVEQDSFRADALDANMSILELLARDVQGTRIAEGVTNMTENRTVESGRDRNTADAPSFESTKTSEDLDDTEDADIIIGIETSGNSIEPSENDIKQPETIDAAISRIQANIRRRLSQQRANSSTAAEAILGQIRRAASHRLPNTNTAAEEMGGHIRRVVSQRFGSPRITSPAARQARFSTEIAPLLAEAPRRVVSQRLGSPRITSPLMRRFSNAPITRLVAAAEEETKSGDELEPRLSAGPSECPGCRAGVCPASLHQGGDEEGETFII